MRQSGEMSEDEYYEVFRPAVEAKRGIVRDVNQKDVAGKIIRSKEWLLGRIDLLKGKKKDSENRLRNIDAELKQRQKELKTK